MKALLLVGMLVLSVLAIAPAASAQDNCYPGGAVGNVVHVCETYGPGYTCEDVYILNEHQPELSFCILW